MTCFPICAKKALRLELEPCRTRRVRQRLHPPVIQISAAIEHHGLDPFFLGPLRHQLADRLRARHVPAVDPALFVGRRRHHRVTLRVVDYLRVNMPQAAEYRQTRPLFAARQAMPNALVNAQPNLILRVPCHTTSLLPLRSYRPSYAAIPLRSECLCSCTYRVDASLGC